MWANVARYYQRVAVLLGSLVQLQRAHAEAPAGRAAASALSAAAGGALAELNPLNVMPVRGHEPRGGGGQAVARSQQKPAPPSSNWCTMTNARLPAHARAQQRPYNAGTHRPVGCLVLKTPLQVVARFQYLPISTPAAGAAGLASNSGSRMRLSISTANSLGGAGGAHHGSGQGGGGAPKTLNPKPDAAGLCRAATPSPPFLPSSSDATHPHLHRCV